MEKINENPLNSMIYGYNQKHHQDPSGKSLVNGTLLILNSGATTEVSCYSWSDEMKIEDYVVVGINSKEFENWLTNYYQ